MEKLKSMPLKSLILLMALVTVVLTGCKVADRIHEVPAEDSYTYENPDAVRAEPDAGFEINGVLDETAYKNNNWLYLHNEDGGNNVDIAMTSYYGEKGMYFVYDVTESVPIYVNTKRPSYMNSCIEMYLAPSSVSGVQENSVFEIDMLPTGDLTFKKSNGQYGYTNVITTNSNMAVLGATTKGGEVNTPECYGYCLELFIPWEYMRWLEMDVEAMKNGFVYVNPAHITSNNINGTDSNLDRYWYFYAQQNGAAFTDVSQYFRFNGQGVLGAVPVVLESGEHYTITGAPVVIPGMITVVTIQPEEGYALSSVMVNGEEQIHKVDFNQDGSVTLKVRSPKEGIKVSAKAEAVSEGVKTLSGRVILNNLKGDSFKGLVLSYFGPKGEKPLEIDANGKFRLEDMEQGYYVLKAEKEGYTALNRGIYLNRDIQIELVLEYNAFTPTQGSCWILDDQNNGVICKMGGTGVLMSNDSYGNFDYSVNLKYDRKLAGQGASDYFLQQRGGMRIEFSNGKTWHIDLMKENDKYILQYAKFSGDNSVTNWRTVHVLNDAEIAKYLSKDGLRLRIMRQGQHAAVWLGDTLLVIELFDETYKNCSAKLGMEFWVYNTEMMEIPFRISSKLPVDVAGSPFHWPAEIWDISDQYNGTITKYPAPGKDTWLDTKINVNDVTTIAKDLSPETRDYSFAYIFKFSNGENFRVRLHHTDNDGKYRIQSFYGSTLFAEWKNHYTLTEEQAKKIGTEGVAYRVWIAGTTAYVFIDGEAVCSYDISTNIHTGKPSGIEKATSTVSFRLDGNLNGNTVIPFKLVYNTQTPPEVSLIPSEIPYNDFTATAYLKYDKALAGQGTTDAHVQQRSGMKISFSNGKNWHVHMMKEDDKYIVQYAKMSGDNSVFNWRTVRVLTEAEAAQYESAEGIRLQVMRQGRHGAVWLGDTLLVIELLGEEYLTATAKLSTEAWVSGQSAADVVLSIADSVPVDVAGSPFHWPAGIWDISGQYDGTFTKHPAPGKDTWLDSKINSNDVTTIAKDLTPEARDYSFVYIFKFSNGENFRVRLNHTDNDGKYRIQSFAGSTLFAPWKNHYTLTDEQAAKVGADGIAYRVWISGTTAYVYIDGEMVCTYDLSTNVNTGAPSGIENATSTVSFRLDGNLTGDTVIPFQLKLNHENPPQIEQEDTPDVPPVTEPDPDQVSYGDFTATAYLKYDTQLATQGTTDAHVQQRSGMKISFSNGKNWHVHMMKEDDKYIVQYAKMSGDNSVFNWRTVHVLTDAEAAQYESPEGIRLQIMRQGRHPAVWLGDTLLVIELLGEEFLSATAQFAPEAWVAGQSAEDIELTVSQGVPVDVAGSPFHWPAGIWDISGQYNGTFTKHPAPGKDTWLDSKINANDVTTIAKDLTPEARDYAFVYIFKFSNGENFRVRLNHTDNDGKYRIQSFAGSTLFAPWKNHYTLTDEQAAKVGTDGIAYRVWIAGTTAYVFIDGELVCTYDLSTNVNTGAPSGIENATATVSFRLDGNLTGDTVIPFVLKNNVNEVFLNIAATEKGTVTAHKTAYQLGDTVKLTVTAAEGYTPGNLTINGASVAPEEDGTYSFIAEQNVYNISAAFISGNLVNINIVDCPDGTITTDKESYELGDTVILTVVPNTGYSQKLYINGEPLLLDWKSNTYRFVATEKQYEITGSFEQSLNLTPSDGGRWDASNQAHGILTTRYPGNNDSWWMDIRGEYNSITVKAKNYFSVADSMDGNGKVGFAVLLRVTMDNGKVYAFRVINDKGTYAYDRYGYGGSLTGWGSWKNLSSLADAFNGEGVDFKLERTEANKLTMSVNGTVMETYTMDGVTEANKVASISVQHNGNAGADVVIPFVLTAPEAPEDATGVQLNIANMTNGSVTPGKTSYNLGDTVTLTVTPADGYAQKLYINGQPLLLKDSTGKYSFVATEEVYEITGSFEAKRRWFWTGDWILINQGHGIAHAPAHTSGEKTGELVPEKGACNGVSVLVKDVSHGAQKDYAVVLKMAFVNGSNAVVRLIDRDDNGKYCLQAMGDSFSDWSTLYWLKEEENTAVVNGDGVWYNMTREGTMLRLSINGNVVKEIDMSSKGITAATVLDQVKVQAYNFGYAVDIPYIFQMNN